MKLRMTMLLLLAALPLHGAQAKVPPEVAAQLDGPKLTCMGAERAASSDGVPASCPGTCR